MLGCAENPALWRRRIANRREFAPDAIGARSGIGTVAGGQVPASRATTLGLIAIAATGSMIAC